MATVSTVGVGSGGSEFNTTYEKRSFPAVPYNFSHFTPREECPSETGGVTDYNNPKIVRDCYLVGLCDLWGSQHYVRERIAEYLNNLISLGVAGEYSTFCNNFSKLDHTTRFRVDSAKHMWPEDIVAIQSLLDPLSTDHGKKLV